MKALTMHCPRLRWLEVAVFTPVFSLLQASTNSQELDEVESLMSALYSNNLAINRFDVIVNEDFTRSAVHEDEAQFVGRTGWKAVSRVMVDYVDEEVFMLRQENVVLPKPEPSGPEVIEERWERVHFADGKGLYIWLPDFAELVRRPDGLLTSRYTNLPDVMRSQHVPAIDFATLRSPFKPLGYNREEWVNKFIWTSQTASLRRLEDGTSVITWPKERAPGGIQTTVTVDGITQMPRTKIATYGPEDARYVLSKIDFRIENADGIYRATHLQIEQREAGFKNPKTGIGVPVNDLGMIEIQWLKMNGDDWNFPTPEEVTTDKERWKKLLKHQIIGTGK
jgi:hypothetical protein